ncbi:Lrp/AsnC family transcriptional regulator [Ascidiimonas aurantiaca]|uniref:Lrp/AsnC family transcriptional regulator n=1 Tax=Ascidiimonas aurantiaca TaxID=1685432 RepID=UPI0030EBC6CF
MDGLNRKILKVLRNNARSSYAEIGRIVGLSAPSVAERIQKMEDAGCITGYKAQWNLMKLGYPIQANIALKTDAQRFRMFITKLSEFPEIFDCVKVTGEHCVLLRAAVQDNHQLEELIDRLTLYGHPNTSIILSDYSDQTDFKP